MVSSLAPGNIARDARGYRRAIATQPGYHHGRVPGNRGRRYAADPPTTEEIIELVHGCPESPTGRRTKALIILLRRSGLRISEALALESATSIRWPDRSPFAAARAKDRRHGPVGLDADRPMA